MSKDDSKPKKPKGAAEKELTSGRWNDFVEFAAENLKIQTKGWGARSLCFEPKSDVSRGADPRDGAGQHAPADLGG